MNEVEKLFDQAKRHAAEAKALLQQEVPELEKAEELLAEAQNLRKRAETVKSAEKILEEMTAPVRDVPLPVGGPDTSGDNPQAGASSTKEVAAKAIYTMRYGDEDAAAKAVLVDLHGVDFETKRYDQMVAFNKYIRKPQWVPTGVEEKLLKEVILTPAYAKDAVLKGLEVKFIKDTMVEAVDTLGGYIVPVDFQTEVIRRLQGFVVMRGKARQMTTSRDRVEIPKLTGGDDQYTTAVRVTWVDETPTAGTAETNLTWGMEAINVHTVMAETPLSRNVVEDAAVNLVDELTTAFAEAAGIDEDNRFLTGDGVGKPQGLLKGGTTPIAGITEVVSGAAGALTWDGLIDLSYGVASQYRSRCILIMERATVKTIRKFKDGLGQYLWQPDQKVGQPTELLGYVVAEQEAMPSIAANTYPILFGDPMGYRIVDRIGMSVERYLDSATARTNSVIYVMRRRLGGQLTNPERWAVQKVST